MVNILVAIVFPHENTLCPIGKTHYSEDQPDLAQRCPSIAIICAAVDAVLPARNEGVIGGFFRADIQGRETGDNTFLDILRYCAFSRPFFRGHLHRRP